MDLSNLSDSDLEALSKNDIASISDAGLRLIAGEQETITPAKKTKKEIIKEALSPPTNYGYVPADISDLPRQLGLTARAAITGATSLPVIGADALTGLINLIAGKQVMIPSSKGLQSLMTQAGIPEAQTPLERVIQDIGGAASGVAAPVSASKYLGPMAKEFFTSSPIGQSTAAIGGALAGGTARESDIGPAGQVLASLGGAMAPAGVTSGQAVARGAKQLVKPFTEEGREVITGNILRSLAREPEQAIKAAEGYTPSIPGYTPTTAQATRDIGLISAETPIRSMATMGQFEAQASSANQARLAILDRMAKDKKALDDAIKHRDEVTKKIREDAFSAPFDENKFNSNVYQSVFGKIDEILASDVGARKTVRNAMSFARQAVEDGIGSPSRLYEARKDLRDAAQGLLDKDGSAYSLAKNQLEQVIRAVDSAIESAAPGYSDYLKKYAASSRGIERLEAAQEFRGKVLSVTPDPGRIGDFLISQPSFTRAIRAAEKETDLSKTQLAVLKRVAEDLDSGVLNRAGRVPGSDTFKNISTANVIGAIIGKQMFGEVPASINKAAFSLNWLFNGTDDQIRELLVRSMLEPKLAADLMKKANIMTIEPLSQQLKKRAINMGYGASFGLTE
jgi:hypothetical protein